jgi:hypothetical protein
VAIFDTPCIFFIWCFENKNPKQLMLISFFWEVSLFVMMLSIPVVKSVCQVYQIVLVNHCTKHSRAFCTLLKTYNNLGNSTIYYDLLLSQLCLSTNEFIFIACSSKKVTFVDMKVKVCLFLDKCSTDILCFGNIYYNIMM